MMFDTFYGKKVFVTGHTGFKGAWLCEWLLTKGADVTGFSLEPPSRPDLYTKLNIKDRIARDYRADIRDRDLLKRVIAESQPDFIFHLAAQTLVGEGYSNPVFNYETNIIGTINVLEAIRELKQQCVCIVVTTDKVYENEEWIYSYRENDALGGFDPYSASKGCADIVTSSYIRSYFNREISNKGVIKAVAAVRAGNVIGGGDWAKDRIVPDCIRSLLTKEAIPVRNKVSTRPWQHVLEPLSGYLLLAEEMYKLAKSDCRRELIKLCSAFNFGPCISSNQTVKALVEEILTHWEGTWVDVSYPNAVHEAGMLNLSSDKAYHLIKWRPRWDFSETVETTVEWYRQYASFDNGTIDRDMATEKLIQLTRSQIKKYENSDTLA